MDPRVLANSSSDEIGSENMEEGIAATDQTDLDASGVLLVTPSGQLRNRIKQYIEAVWEYKNAEESLNFEPILPLAPNSLKTDPKQLFWTGTPDSRHVMKP